MIPRARGEALTRLEGSLGCTRRRFLFFFREPDFLFRRRLLAVLRTPIKGLADEAC